MDERSLTFVAELGEKIALGRDRPWIQVLNGVSRALDRLAGAGAGRRNDPLLAVMTSLTLGD